MYIKHLLCCLIQLTQLYFVTSHTKDIQIFDKYAKGLNYNYCSGMNLALTAIRCGRAYLEGRVIWVIYDYAKQTKLSSVRQHKKYSGRSGQ